jgi:AcrR family transcriptional regulator
MGKARTAALHRRLAAEEILLPPGTTPRGSRGVVLGVALRLFAERGYGGTSVRDIAKEAGIQPATMYAHYPSKEHVLAELVKVGHEEHQRHLREAMLETSAEPANQLRALTRAHVRFHADYPLLAVVSNAELHALSPKFAAPSLELRQQSEVLLLEVVERGVKLKMFKTPDPYLAMAAIGSMGLRVAHWYTPAFEKSAEEVAAIYGEFALRIVGAR